MIDKFQKMDTESVIISLNKEIESLSKELMDMRVHVAKWQDEVNTRLRTLESKADIMTQRIDLITTRLVVSPIRVTSVESEIEPMPKTKLILKPKTKPKTEEKKNEGESEGIPVE